MADAHHPNNIPINPPPQPAHPPQHLPNQQQIPNLNIVQIPEHFVDDHFIDPNQDNNIPIPPPIEHEIFGPADFLPTPPPSPPPHSPPPICYDQHDDQHLAVPFFNLPFAMPSVEPANHVSDSPDCVCGTDDYSTESTSTADGLCPYCLAL